MSNNYCNQIKALNDLIENLNKNPYASNIVKLKASSTTLQPPKISSLFLSF